MKAHWLYLLPITTAHHPPAVVRIRSDAVQGCRELAAACGKQQQGHRALRDGAPVAEQASARRGTRPEAEPGRLSKQAALPPRPQVAAREPGCHIAAVRAVGHAAARDDARACTRRGARRPGPEDAHVRCSSRQPVPSGRAFPSSHTGTSLALAGSTGFPRPFNILKPRRRDTKARVAPLGIARKCII